MVQDVKVNQDTSLAILQNETSLAFNPAFSSPACTGLNVIVAHNDDPGDSLGTGTSGLGISYSCDGGATWTDTQTPLPFGFNPSDAVFDPSLGVDTLGRAYAAFIIAQGPAFTGTSAVWLAESFDGGASWVPAPMAADIRQWPGGMAPPVEFLDKCWLAVDTSASPFQNNVYVAYQADQPNGVTTSIWVARSPDGMNFFAPVQIDDASPNPALGNSPVCAVGSMGQLYVAWHDAPTNSHQPARLLFDRSLNGGMAFGPDVVVTTYRRPPQWPRAGQDFKVRGFPAIAADPRLASQALYVVYAHDPDAQNETRLDGGLPGAASSFEPALAVVGNNVYAAWEDRRGDPGDTSGDVYFNRSSDAGGTWGSDVRISTKASGTSRTARIQLAAAGSSVHAVWEDDRNGATDIYTTRSTNSGSSWPGADVRLDTDTAGASVAQRPRIALAGSHVYVVWEDLRSGGNTDLRFQHSSDGGANWLANDVRINVSTHAGGAFPANPRIVAQGNGVWVVFAAPVSGAPDAFLQRSSDNGATWLPSDLRLDTDPAGLSASLDPELAISGSNVFCVWTDRRRPNTPFPGFSDEIRLNYSTDGGQTFQPSDLLVDSTLMGMFSSSAPDVACSGPTAHVVWVDRRLQPLGGVADLYTRPFDASTGLLGFERQLNTNESVGNSAKDEPRIVTSGNEVHVAWQDGRFGLPSVHYQRSPDGGATWWGECAPYADQRLDVGAQPGTSSAAGIVLAAASGRAYAAWQSLAGPPARSDILFVRSTNSGAARTSSPSSGAAIPSPRATW
jgi:hypothetical protein